MKPFVKINVIAGEKFNNLTIIKEVEPHVQPSGQRNRKFLCKCDCGNEKKVRLIHLRIGSIKSCGCMAGELHGDTGTS